jgi:hypothetical protein
MKAAKYLLPAAALCGALMLAPASAPACNGNGNCENAPGHNKFQGAPGPVVGAGLPVLVVGYSVYWLVKRRRRRSKIGTD